MGKEDVFKNYDRELVGVLVDPYLHVLKEHLDRLESPDVGREQKLEHIEDIEDMLTKSEVSTSPSVLGEFPRFVSLLRDTEISDPMTVMIGHISQNVQVVASKFLSLGIFPALRTLYAAKPSSLNKTAFLLQVLLHTLPSALGTLKDEGLAGFVAEATGGSPTTQERMGKIKALLQ